MVDASTQMKSLSPASLPQSPVVRWLLLIAFYTAASGLMVNPYVNFGELARASYEGDARLIIWTLAWDNHAILTGHSLFDANIFYPTHGSLPYNEHLFGLSLFTLPLYAATHNPVLAYNVVWLLSFPLNGLCAHALLKRLTGSEMAAIPGSLIYTFSFYKMHHAHGHLQHIWTWLIPLSVACLERWKERPSLSRAAVWALTVVLQALTSWYLAVMVLLVQTLAVTVMSARYGRAVLSRAWHLVVVSVVSAAIMWPFAVPYRVLPASPPTEAAMYATDLDAYIVPPENTLLGQLWLADNGRGPLWIWGERTVFIGWLALALAAAGAWQLWRRSKWDLLTLYGGITVIAFVLSLGPNIGRSGGSWSLFSALTSLPGLGGLRAPARFALLVVFGISILAAFGTMVLDRVPGGRIALIAIVPLMLSEWYVVKFPGGKPQPFVIPPIYRTEAVATARALVSLPSYRATPEWYSEADYLYYSTAHWRPIVNGFGRSEPPDHPHVISHMMAFPGPNNARTMRQLGVEYVVFHAARYPEGGKEPLRAALDSPEYQLVAQAGTDYLFKVRPVTDPAR